MSKFSETQTVYLKQQFNTLDVDKDGKITQDEFIQNLKSAKLNPADYDLDAYFQGQNSIDFNKFVEVSQKLGLVEAFTATGSTTHNSSADLLANFKQFDKDGDGKITKEELAETLGLQGAKVSNEELDQMIKSADTNKDGKVDKSEFSKIYQ